MNKTDLLEGWHFVAEDAQPRIGFSFEKVPFEILRAFLVQNSMKSNFLNLWKNKIKKLQKIYPNTDFNNWKNVDNLEKLLVALKRKLGNPEFILASEEFQDTFPWVVCSLDFSEFMQVCRTADTSRKISTWNCLTEKFPNLKSILVTRFAQYKRECGFSEEEIVKTTALFQERLGRFHAETTDYIPTILGGKI